MGEVSPRFRNTIILLMIFSGALNTLNFKFQNKQMVTEGGTQKQFFHPYIQTASCFLGQSFAMILFIVMRKLSPREFEARKEQAIKEVKKINMNKFLIAIPAMCDLLTSTVELISLNFIPASVYQMIRGGSILSTFLFSVLFLKMKPKKHQKFGSFLAFIGVFIVGLSSFLYSDSQSSSTSTDQQLFGYILLLIGLLNTGVQFAFEEKLLNKYHIQASQMVGYEGLFGFAANIVLIAIITFVPCGLGSGACVATASGELFVERPDIYFEQLGKNTILLVFCILGVFSVSIFNVTGISVTKHINAKTRAICDVSRALIVWVVGIIITLTIGKQQANYVWESTDTGPVLIQLVGFSIIVAGNLIYNKVVTIGCLEIHSSLPLDTVLNDEITDDKLI